MTDTLFDGSLPPADAPEPSRAATVKCGGCGSLILMPLALIVGVTSYEESYVDPADMPLRRGTSCRQPGCVATVARELAAEWAI